MDDKSRDNEILEGFLFGITLMSAIAMKRHFNTMDEVYQQIPLALQQIVSGKLTLIESDSGESSATIAQFVATIGTSPSRPTRAERHREIASSILQRLPRSLPGGESPL